MKQYEVPPPAIYHFITRVSSVRGGEGGGGTKLKIMFSLYGLWGNILLVVGREGSQWMFANVGFGHCVQ